MNYPLYNSSLCPDIWDKKNGNWKMKSDVRARLLKIADDFSKEYLKEAGLTLSIKDVILMGSSANYNWNKYSDIDLHLVFDYSELKMSPEDAFTLLTAIKINWKNSHDITIKGHELEIGVQGLDQKNHSKSEYSVKKNAWIVPPKIEGPKFDKETIKKKHKDIKNRIDSALKSGSDEKLRKILEKLYLLRQAGLDKQGEYSAENIVFKILRAQGYLDRLKDRIKELYDKEMTLNESNFETDEGLGVGPDKEIVWSDDEEGKNSELVPTDDDHARRVFNVYGTPTFAAYRIMPGVSAMMKADYGNVEAAEIKTDIRHAVKHPKSNSSKDTVEKLVELSVERMFNDPKFNIKDVTVLVPLGSRSGLNNIIAEKIKLRLPNVAVLPDLVKKTTWANVRPSEAYYREKKANPNSLGVKFADSIFRQRQGGNQSNEIFQISGIPMTMRRYFSFFYYANGDETVSSSQLKNATVLMIDDTLEQAITFIEAKRVISQFSPKLILGYVFLFGRNAT